jgi:integrase
MEPDMTHEDFTTVAPRQARRRNSSLTVRTVETAKPGSVLHDGHGIYLKTGKNGGGKWIFRFTNPDTHRVTEIGLGSSRNVTLAEARAKAAEARKLVASGVNPITARRTAKARKAAQLTFGQCANALLAAKASEWRNEVHRSQWRTTLETYAAPLWGLPVDQVTTEAVLGVLSPLWQSIPETASRLRGRIESVLDYAKAHGWRSGENPAAWRGHLALILPKRGKLSRGHHAAMPFDDVPGFVARLREREALAARALEFLILTAARSGEVLGAAWSETDLAIRVWTIPAARMKSGREHRVPLPERAVEILQRLAETRIVDTVFPICRTSLTKLLPSGATLHGFRSSFRDWCGESTSFPREVAEAALAHSTGDATERAYRRGDALEKRRTLMEAWAAFCEPKESSNVITMARLV